MFFINKALLPAKGHYLAFFGAVAGVLPFLARIAMQFGATPSVVGYIYSSLPFIVLLFKGIFGALADKYQQKKSILVGSVVIMTCAFFTIDFIPKMWHSSSANVLHISLRCVNYTDHSSLYWCPSSTLPNLTFSADGNQLRDDCKVTCRLKDEKWTQTNCENNTKFCNSTTINSNNALTNFSFYLLPNKSNCHEAKFIEEIPNLTLSSVCLYSHNFSCDLMCSNYTAETESQKSEAKINPKVISLWVLMGIAYIGMGVGTSIGDTIILDMLEEKKNFGRERLWGAVGWGLMSVVTGQLIDWLSPSENELNFTPGLCVVLILGVIDIIIILTLKVEKTEKPVQIFRNVGRLFWDPEVAVFALSVFIVGYLTSALWTFLIVYLNELGASQFLVGLTMGVQCFLGEIPFFFISNWFLKKLGHAHAMTVVLLVFAFRLVCYSLLENPWLVLPIELTQGITYSIFFTALATYGNMKAHPSIQSTVQGILQGLFEGLGVGVGSVVSGIAYEYFGSKLFFRFTGILAAIFAFVIGLAQCFIARRNRNRLQIIACVTENKLDDSKTEEMSKMIFKDETNTNHGAII